MKRMLGMLFTSILFVLLAWPSVAHAQYQHAAFFNGGTTLTATCHFTSGTVTASDVFLGTSQGNTTVTLPSAATGCVDYSVIDLRYTQAASQSFTLTVAAGAGTALVVTSNNGNLLAAPAGAASGAANILHQIWVYNAVATTPQWELVTQETNTPQTTGQFTNACVGANPCTLDGTTGDFSATVAVKVGTTPPAITAGTAGLVGATEGSAPTTLSAADELWADSTDHIWKINANGGSNLDLIAASTLGGASGTFLYGQGTTTTPIWSTLTMPNAATQGDLLDATGANAIGRLTAVATGQVLTSAGTSTVPAYSATPVLGVAASQAGTLGLAKGVGGGNVWTLASAATSAWTMTSAATAPAQGDILDFSNATGQMSSVVDVATGSVLVSGGVGAVPTYSSSPTISGANITSLSAANISAGTLAIARGGTNQTTGATSFCMGTSASIATATTDFIACGENPGVTVIGTETNDQVLIPAICTISNLSVKLTTAANANTPVITVDKNTAGQTLTCTVANTATTCTDVSHSFTTAAGDLLSVKLVNPTSANATGVVYMAFQINC